MLLQNPLAILHEKQFNNKSGHTINKNKKKLRIIKECSEDIIGTICKLQPLCKMLLLYFVSQGIEFAAMESFDETGPCHRLPFSCQPLLQNLPCDSMRLSKTVVFNGVNQNAFVILEQESPEFFVFSSDILDHFKIE